MSGRMSLVKRFRRKKRVRKEFQVNEPVQSSALECVKDKCGTDQEEITRDARELARRRSSKNCHLSNSNGEGSSGTTSSKETSTKTESSTHAVLSGAVADDESTDGAKGGGVAKGDGCQVVFSCGNSTRSGKTKVKRKAPPPPRPASPHPALPHPNTSRPAPPRPAPPPPRPSRPGPPRPPPPTAKRTNKKNGTASERTSKGLSSIEYPKNLNPFGGSISSTDDDHWSQESEKTSGARRKRRGRKAKKSKNDKYPVEYNPFGDIEEGKCSSGCEGTVCKITPDVGDKLSSSSRDDITCAVNKGALSLLPKAQLVSIIMAGKDEKEELETQNITPHVAVSDIGDSVDSMAQEHSVNPDEASSSDNVESAHKLSGSAGEIKGSPEISNNRSRDGTAPVDEEQTLKESKPHKEADYVEDDHNQQSDDSSVSHPNSELAMYVENELQALAVELLSLDKVLVKLEFEMQRAMNEKDCEYELEGLSLDWLSLTKFRLELVEKRELLHTLGRQQDTKECLNILRCELRCLLEVEDWRKTNEHRAREENVLNLVVQLAQHSLND